MRDRLQHRNPQVARGRVQLGLGGPLVEAAGGERRAELIGQRAEQPQIVDAEWRVHQHQLCSRAQTYCFAVGRHLGRGFARRCLDPPCVVVGLEDGHRIELKRGPDLREQTRQGIAFPDEGDGATSERLGLSP